MKKNYVLFSLLTLVFLFGCTKRMVPLVYETSEGVKPTCTEDIGIIPFVDARDSYAIGVTEDNKKILPKSDVSKWVDQALFDELKKAGCVPIYPVQFGEPETSYVVKGKVRTVNLYQISATHLKCTIEVDVTLKRGEKLKLKRNFVSTVERRALPDIENSQEILAETLQTLMNEMVYTLISETI